LNFVQSTTALKIDGQATDKIESNIDFLGLTGMRHGILPLRVAPRNVSPFFNVHECHSFDANGRGKVKNQLSWSDCIVRRQMLIALDNQEWEQSRVFQIKVVATNGIVHTRTLGRVGVIVGGIYMNGTKRSINGSNVVTVVSRNANAKGIVACGRNCGYERSNEGGTKKHG